MRIRLSPLAHDKKQEYVLKVVENDLLNNKKINPIFNLPAKLPMVCTPKPYSSDSLGGYLLNDEKYIESIFIDKRGYAFSSELDNKNDIYDMVNKMSSTPFKVNKDVL